MTDEQYDSRGQEHAGLAPGGGDSMAVRPDTDQPSDAGYEDYVLDPWEDAWLCLDDFAGQSGLLDHRGPAASENRH